MEKWRDDSTEAERGFRALKGKSEMPRLVAILQNKDPIFCVSPNSCSQYDTLTETWTSISDREDRMLALRLGPLDGRSWTPE